MFLFFALMSCLGCLSSCPGSRWHLWCMLPDEISKCSSSQNPNCWLFPQFGWVGGIGDAVASTLAGGRCRSKGLPRLMYPCCRYGRCLVIWTYEGLTHDVVKRVDFPAGNLTRRHTHRARDALFLTYPCNLHVKTLCADGVQARHADGVLHFLDVANVSKTYFSKWHGYMLTNFLQLRCLTFLGHSISLWQIEHHAQLLWQSLSPNFEMSQISHSLQYLLNNCRMVLCGQKTEGGFARLSIEKSNSALYSHGWNWVMALSFSNEYFSSCLKW